MTSRIHLICLGWKLNYYSINCRSSSTSVKKNVYFCQGMSYGKGMESANNDARKWSILPFDVSRDFIISNEILVYRETFHWIIFWRIWSVYANLDSTEISRKIPKYNWNVRKISKEIRQYIYMKVGVDYINKSKVIFNLIIATIIFI